MSIYGGKKATERHEGTIVDVNTGLKATSLTSILSVKGKGNILSILMKDPDNLAQNERLKLTIDGNVVLNATSDIAEGGEFILVMESIATQGLTKSTTVGIQGKQTPVPYSKSFDVTYQRPAAGTTGLTIYIVYTKEQ